MTDPTRSPRGTRAALLVLTLAACSPGDTGRGTGEPVEVCRVSQRSVPLPGEVRESSGLAVSRRTPGVLWTHNDSGSDPSLFAVDSTGRLLGRVRVTGAENKDWEDIAAGPCPGGTCLYVGDTGDNDDDRRDVEVYRFPEPAPGDTATRPAERITLVYPGGPRDAEALAVLPGGDLLIVTKGKKETVELYRARAPLRTDAPVRLTRITGLSSNRPERLHQVTGASATPDGRWVAVRTYTALHLFRTDDLLTGGNPASDRVDLAPLTEPQGEAVALRSDGTVFLTSEAPGKGEPGTLSRLVCELP
ncbi:MAG TPA: hypothetical protein VHG28_22755 [Longimicrobiaceae bacterium]|nr:hypothetical protein [Longimicrobiaceae bacterium]